jgi:hypothetical protein
MTTMHFIYYIANIFMDKFSIGGSVLGDLTREFWTKCNKEDKGGG